MGSWISYVVYIVAYCASFAAFSFNSIYWLRGLTIFSSFLFVLYYYIFPVEPLWIDIIAESGMVIINLLMIMRIMNQRKAMSFTEEEKEVYEAFFSNFSSFEFYKLIRKGRWVNVSAGKKLIAKDEPVHDVYFIYNGRLSVRLKNGEVVELSDGFFVGERSFETRELANADVNVLQSSRLISWKQEELHDLLNRNPAMKNSFDSMLHKDLAKKLYR